MRLPARRVGRLAARLVLLMSSSEPAIVFKDRVQQNLGSGAAFLETRRFRFVVADAVAARDEDHSGRTNARGIDRVMAGARYDISRHIARFLGRAPDAADEFRRETDGR
jgi:hypothetical protein